MTLTHNWQKEPGARLQGACNLDSAIDAVHAQDISVIPIAPGQHRMYYAACNKQGNWRIASARGTW
jgi:hypothetical protein